jgi:pre-mRNA-processing factor 40
MPRTADSPLAQELLQELLQKKKIKAKTPWKAVYSEIGTDPRYLAILGNPGSTPLELFWDEVDKLDQIFDPKLQKVEAILKEKDSNITVDTTEGRFKEAIGGADLEGINEEDLDDIFTFVSLFISRSSQAPINCSLARQTKPEEAD